MAGVAPEYPPAAVQHVCSSAHLFCRLCEEGLSEKEARQWAAKAEAALNPILYPCGKCPKEQP